MFESIASFSFARLVSGAEGRTGTFMPKSEKTGLPSDATISRVDSTKPVGFLRPLTLEHCPILIRVLQTRNLSDFLLTSCDTNSKPVVFFRLSYNLFPGARDIFFQR